MKRELVTEDDETDLSASSYSSATHFVFYVAILSFFVPLALHNAKFNPRVNPHRNPKPALSYSASNLIYYTDIIGFFFSHT